MAKYLKSGAGHNWSDGNSWSATSSAGIDNAGAPTATDDVILDSGAGAVIVDTTTCVAKTVTCNAVGNSITFTAVQILTVSGNVTFFAGMTLTGTGNIIVNAAANLTLGVGNTFPGALTLSGAFAFVLGDNWTVTGLVTSATGTKTIAGNQVICNGGLTITGNTSGTTNIILGGTGGIWQGAGTLGHNLTINCVSLTVSGIVYFGAGSKTITYTAGTINTSNSTLFFVQATTVTMNTSGMSWYNIQLNPNSSSVNVTLLSDLICSGTLAVTSLYYTGASFNGLFNIYCGTFSVASYTNGLLESVQFVSRTTLTISTAIYMINFTSVTINSGTSSSPFKIIYNGTQNNSKIVNTIFTDVDASSSPNQIWNWFGGALTRCTNIRNILPSDFQNIFGWIG